MCVCVCVWLQLFKLLRGKSQRSNCKYSFKYLWVCVWVPNLVRFSNWLLLAFVDPDFNFELKCILINVFILFPSFSNLAVEMGDVRDLSWSFKAYTIPRKERRPASEGKKVPCQFWCVFCQSRCCIFPVLKFILPKLRIQFSRLLSHSRGVFQTQNTYHEHISVHFSILS